MEKHERRRLKSKAREQTKREIARGVQPRGEACVVCKEPREHNDLTPDHIDYFSDPPKFVYVCKTGPCHRRRHEEAGDLEEQAMDYGFGLETRPYDETKDWGGENSEAHIGDDFGVFCDGLPLEKAN